MKISVAARANRIARDSGDAFDERHARWEIATARRERGKRRSRDREHEIAARQARDLGERDKGRSARWQLHSR